MTEAGAPQRRQRVHRLLLEPDLREVCRVFELDDPPDDALVEALGEIELTAMLPAALLPWAREVLGSTVPALVLLTVRLSHEPRPEIIDRDWLVEIILRLLAHGAAPDQRGSVERLVRRLVAASPQQAAHWVRLLGQAGFDVSDFLDAADPDTRVAAALVTPGPSATAEIAAALESGRDLGWFASRALLAKELAQRSAAGGDPSATDDTAS